ncbi:arginase family protein [Micromonospora arida]|uniref:arginase family protein n=1 Tax=Micromonospora arida TaxID=2203715 RepID=UPI0033E04581
MITIAIHDVIMRRIMVLDAASNLGLAPPRDGHEPGVRMMPAALRDKGIVLRLSAEDAGRLEPPPYSFDLEPVTGYRNGSAIAQFAAELADRPSVLLDSGGFPLVLGGDCSIVLGPTLALRRRGSYGLAFLDGHDDYSPPRHPPKIPGRYTAAGLDLGLATGHGPDLLTNHDGLRPYVEERHVVHIGLDREPEDESILRVEDFSTSAIRSYPIEHIHAHGASTTASQALADLNTMPIEGFWIHLDADVLDKSVMPAVDSPNPDGLSVNELTRILATLLASPNAVGMHVGIYDPELDPTGQAATALVDAIVSAFETANKHN